MWTVSALLILVLFLAGIATWYVSSEQGQNTIRLIVSEQTGNTVSFERVGLSLLLRPHLTFRQVTVTVPDATTGSIESARLYPQYLPLLTGSFRIAELRAESPHFVALLSEHPDNEGEQITYGEVKKSIKSVLDIMRAISVDLVIEVKKGTLTFRKSEHDVFTAKRINGYLELVPQGFDLDIRGDAGRFGPSSMHGRFVAEGGHLAAHSMKATVLDSSLISSIVLSDSTKGLRLIDISATGNIGQKTVQWVSTALHLPAEQTIRAPLSLSDARFIWKAPSDISLAGAVSILNGPSISVQVRQTPDELRISKLIIKDEESLGSITCLLTKKNLDFTFQGTLREETLNKLFEDTSFHRGMIQGNLRAHVVLENLQESSAQGSIHASNFILPLGNGLLVMTEELALTAERNKVDVQSSSFVWADTHFNLKGNITADAEGFHLDMDLTTEGIKTESIQQALVLRQKQESDAPNKKISQPFHYPPIFGIIRLNAKYISYGDYTAAPAQADMILGETGFQVAIQEATVCGISLPGSVTWSDGEIQLDVRPVALQQPLESTLTCLRGRGKEDARITGTFDLRGHLRSHGKTGDLLHKLHGGFTFDSRAGDIYRYALLSNIFEAISISQWVRGKIPHLSHEGLSYTAMTVKGTITKGNLELQEAVIDTPTVDVFGQGDINIAKNKINLTVLVAPFTNVDFVIRNTPLVNKIMNNTLITFAATVTGDLGNPNVVAVSPTAIGEGLLGIIKRTLKLPYTLVEPLFPKKKPKEY